MLLLKMNISNSISIVYKIFNLIPLDAVKIKCFQIPIHAAKIKCFQIPP